MMDTGSPEGLTHAAPAVVYTAQAGAIVATTGAIAAGEGSPAAGAGVPAALAGPEKKKQGGQSSKLGPTTGALVRDDLWMFWSADAKSHMYHEYGKNGHNTARTEFFVDRVVECYAKAIESAEVIASLSRKEIKTIITQ